MSICIFQFFINKSVPGFCTINLQIKIVIFNPNRFDLYVALS